MSATKPSKAMLCNKTPKGYAMHPQTWGLLYELSGFSGQLNYHIPDVGNINQNY